MKYNPFNKPLDELTADDLNVLINNEVTEGYWIEYKSEFQESKKISKSIASFANTFGGWYLVGVKADKTKNVATDICGFSLTDIPDPIAKLRDSIKSNIDPIPVFHPKLIDIGSGRATLIVQIPDNQNTPFINRNGRIYRRVGDSSDPVPENNRNVVDRLVDNGRELVKQFADFCRDERTFSKAEEEQSWVNIFLSPYPLGAIERYDMLSTDGIENLIQLSQSPIKIHFDDTQEIGSGNLPFNSGQIGVGSVILRQVEPSKIAFNSLTAELFADGRAKFFVPLRIMMPVLEEANIQQLKSTQVRQALERIAASDRDHSSTLLRFFDIRQLWAIIINLLNFYQKWYGEALEQNNVQVSITMENIWRLVPFCDMDEWGTHVQKFGLPAQNVNFIRIPIEKGKGIICDYPLWKTVCPFIGEGFGLPIILCTFIALKPNSPT